MGILVREIVQMAQAQLERCGVSDAKTDAELIFRHLLNVDKTGFFKLWGTSIDDKTWDSYLELVTKRSEGVPLQHITGCQEFMGINFFVNPNVLIPRQETEVLVAEVIRMIQERGKSCSVLDLGCGSGAIGISVAKLCKNAKVTASDISKRAMETTALNARIHGVERKMDILVGDLLEPFKGRFRTETFDIIVSNPPYIESGAISSLQREVKDHEPLLALDGGVDGLDYYRRIFEKAHTHLKKSGALALEIGEDQAGEISRMAKTTLKTFKDMKLIKDLAGKDRVVIVYT